MISRIPVALSIAAAFAGGMILSHVLERDAHAQASPSSSVYVPADGLAFRSFDGRVVARLSYDSNGGTFEIYDGHQAPGATLRNGAGFAPVSSRPSRTSLAASPALTPPPMQIPPPPDAPRRPAEVVDLGI